jgi:hypothetical protein
MCVLLSKLIFLVDQIFRSSQRKPNNTLFTFLMLFDYLKGDYFYDYDYFQRLFDLNMLSFQLKNFESLHKGGKCQMVIDSLTRHKECHKLWRPFQYKLFTSTDIAFWRVNLFSVSSQQRQIKVDKFKLSKSQHNSFFSNSSLKADDFKSSKSHHNFFSNCNTKYGTSVTCENQQQQKTWLAIFFGSVNAV